jgi:hypothetical protein
MEAMLWNKPIAGRAQIEHRDFDSLQVEPHITFEHGLKTIGENLRADLRCGALHITHEFRRCVRSDEPFLDREPRGRQAERDSRKD